MSNAIKGEELGRTMVCIDSYESGVPVGRLYNQYLPGGKDFYSVTQFLLEMEKTLNDQDFPRVFSGLRKFKEPSEGEPDLPVAEWRKGAVSTFIVRILFRQNASWQGSLCWQDGKQEQCFRSVLELILLMDNALSLKKKS